MASTSQCSADHGDPVCVPDALRYRYAPLPTANSIRILLLQPGRFEDFVVKATLEAAPLSEESDYNAISYSWARDDGCACSLHTLDLGRGSLAITGNLYDGLRRIRSVDEVRRLWIDAVCIDQANSNERSQQVAMMADIYQCAHDTFVWLGESSAGDADGALGADILHFFALPRVNERQADSDLLLFHATSCYQNQDIQGRSPPRSPRHVGTITFKCSCDMEPRTASITTKDIPSWGYTRRKAQVLLKDEAIIVRVHQNLQTLNGFFCKRYWTRHWVMQELCFSRRLNFYWRSYFWELPGRSLLEHVASRISEAAEMIAIRSMPRSTHVQQVAVLLSTQANLVSRLGKAILSRGMLQNCPRVLIRCLDFCSEMDCSDSRDRLYAVASIAKERVDEGYWIAESLPLEITPNYHLSAEEVFLGFSQQLAAAGYTEILFTHASVGRPGDSTMSTPSWAIDLRKHFKVYVTR